MFQMADSVVVWLLMQKKKKKLNDIKYVDQKTKQHLFLYSFLKSCY